VPLSLAITRLFNSGAQFFLLPLSFSMLFFWGFATHVDLAPLTFMGPYATTTGHVTRSQDTNSRQARRSVFANHYEFSVAGTKLQGVSYGDEQQKGSEVSVEYRTAKPADSRFAGMRRAEFGPGALLVLIFPVAIGLAFFATLRFGRSEIELLRNGIITDGTLKQRLVTGRGNSVKLEFTFTSRNGGKRTASRLVRGGLMENEAKYPDGTVEAVLYDPEKPSSAQMMTDEKGHFSVDEQGQLRPRPIAAFAALVLPVLFVAGNLLALWTRFF